MKTENENLKVEVDGIKGIAYRDEGRRGLRTQWVAVVIAADGQLVCEDGWFRHAENALAVARRNARQVARWDRRVRQQREDEML